LLLHFFQAIIDYIVVECDKYFQQCTGYQSHHWMEQFRRG